MSLKWNTTIIPLHFEPQFLPCSSCAKLSCFDGELLLNLTKYRHVIGVLQYCTLTRPEIAFSINQLCQHMHASSHLTVAKRVLRY
jgi:hypothetical protein